MSANRQAQSGLKAVSTMERFVMRASVGNLALLTIQDNFVRDAKQHVP